MTPPKKPPLPAGGGDGWAWGACAVFFGAALIGGFVSAWDAGREYGMREERRKQLLKQLNDKENNQCQRS